MGLIEKMFGTKKSNPTESKYKQIEEQAYKNAKQHQEQMEEQRRMEAAIKRGQNRAQPIELRLGRGIVEVGQKLNAARVATVKAHKNFQKNVRESHPQLFEDKYKKQRKKAPQPAKSFWEL